MMQTANINRMETILGAVRGARFAGLTTATETRMNKTNGVRSRKDPNYVRNPFHGLVLSVRNISFLFCYDYEANVERAREKHGAEGDFRRGTSWHRPIKDEKDRRTPFVEHPTTGVKYVYGRTLHKGPTTYVLTETVEFKGQTYEPGPIDYEVFEQFVPVKRSYANQGLPEGEEIAATCLKLTSVRGMRVNGERFRIEQPNEIEEIAETLVQFLGDMPEVTEDDIPSNLRETA